MRNILILIPFYFVNGIVLPPGTSTKRCACQKKTKCLNYDSTRLAVSLDEAMVSFPNLATHQGPLYNVDDEHTAWENSHGSGGAEGGQGLSTFSVSDKVSAPVNPAVMTSKTFMGTAKQKSSCVTDDCRSCQLSIVEGLLQHACGDDREPLMRQKQQLESSGANAKQCGKMTTRKKRDVAEERRKRQSDSDDNTVTSGSDNNTIITDNDPNGNSTSKLLGTWTDISCDYKRGDPLQRGEDFCGLCNLCWRWRQLPITYFPRYVNEVSCDDVDSACLSGFGSCRPILRSLSVLRSNGDPDKDNWDQVTIYSVSACECQVKVGTPLHDLVSR